MINRLPIATRAPLVALALLAGITGAAGAQNAGDYRSAASGSWADASTWETFSGVAWIPAVEPPDDSDGVITVRNGHVVTVAADVSIDETGVEAGGRITVADTVALTVVNDLLNVDDLLVAGELHVENGGTVSVALAADLRIADGGVADLDPTGMIEGGGDFEVASGGSLEIGSADGITASAASGNVQNTGNRTFSVRGNYTYDGGAAQATGDGLPGAVNRLTIDNANGVTLTADTATSGTPAESGELSLNAGTLHVDTNQLRIDGVVTQSAGDIDSAPAGTVTYNQASAGQDVATGNYGNLTFSNFGKVLPSTGTVGISGSFNPGAASHTITGSTIDFNGAGSQEIPAFDYFNLTSSSTGGRTLASSGVIKIAGAFTPGGDNSYTIAGSTVEYNGSGSQTITGFTYHNLSSSGTGARTLGTNASIAIANLFLPGTNGYTVTGSTVEYNGSSAQTLPSSFNPYHNLTLDNSAGTSGFAGLTVNALLRVQSGTFTSASDYHDVQIDDGATLSVGASNAISVSGDWTNDGTFGQAGVTVTFDGSAGQTLGGSTALQFASVEMTGTELTLSKNLTVSGTLALTSGRITTDDFVVIIQGGGSVARTTGHVNGNLRKSVSAASPSVLYEIGSGTDYAPVQLDFGSVTQAGDMTASTTGALHGDIAGAGFVENKRITRYHTLTRNGNPQFSALTATFNWVAGDVEAMADANDFAVRSQKQTTWRTHAVASPTGTSIQATGIRHQDFITGQSSFPVDFSAGELQTFTITATQAANGSITPVGVQIVDFGSSLGYTIAPDAGYHVVDVVVDAASAGAKLSHGFSNIQADHTITASFAETFLTVADVSRLEGDALTTPFRFVMTRTSRVTPHDVEIDYATQDSTAIAPGDYQAMSGTRTFHPDSTTATITVPVVGELTAEPDEVFHLLLSSPVAISAPDLLARAVIVNDDELGSTITINDVSQVETDAGTTEFTFTLTLTPTSGSTVTVDYQTFDGTALAPGDYVSESGTVQFDPGDALQTMDVTVNGDPTNENDETFTVELSNVSNATIGDGTGVGTIEDDDPISFTIDDVSQNEGDAGTSTFGFTVTMSPASDDAITVDFATADGTATTADDDYESAAGTLTFPPGTTTQPVNVSVNGDVTSENDETFVVNLANPSRGSLGDGQGQGTIADDDPLPTVSVGDESIVEGDGGSQMLTFTATLSASSGRQIAVDYATTDGAATVADNDYDATSATLTFPPGETVMMFDVTINGDTRNELDEAFTITLSNASNVTIGDSTATGTIQNDDPEPLVTINDVAVNEGNTGTVNASFTVALDAPSGRTVTIDFATMDDTAVAPGDYVAATGQVTFSPDDVSETLAVQVNGDTKNEIDETFTVVLSNPDGAQLDAVSTGVGTITDNDPVPLLSIADVSVGEGDTGTTDMIFTVALSTVSGRTVTVDCDTQEDTGGNFPAATPDDYTATSATLTFPEDTVTQAFTVSIAGDVLHEYDETLLSVLSNSAAANINDGTAVGTITNDDEIAATISIDDVTLAEGNSGTTPFTFTASLSETSGRVVEADYATANGTATAPSDFGGASGTLTFSPGETEMQVTVGVNGDLSNEANETFTVNLSNLVDVLPGDPEGTGTITNDDPQPNLTIDDAAVVEGNAGTTGAVFTVSVSPAASGKTITIDFATADGTATTSNDDYVAASGTLTIPPNQATGEIVVDVVGDLAIEPNESFFVDLANATNATLVDDEGIGTILDDDLVPQIPSISINDISVTEGDAGTKNATFTLTLSTTSQNTVTVDFGTADGTATTADSDYLGASGQVTFPPGTSSRPLSIVVLGDTTNEADETFFVNLSNASNAMIADDQGEGTIENDDPVAATLSIDDVAAAEGDAGTTDFVFTVTLSEAAGQDVTVDYATADDTATIADGDYSQAAGTLTIDQGDTAGTITVSVNGDTRNEADEAFALTLSSPSGATIDDGEGVGTIQNDDDPPTLSIDDVSVVEGNEGTTEAVFTVSLAPASGLTVTVDYATADGTAVASSGDYDATSGQLTFMPDDTEATITVTVNGDTTDEPAESYFVNLVNPDGAGFGDSQGEGTIENDDTDVLLSIAGVSQTEGSGGGPTSFGLVVSLSEASGDTVRCKVSTGDDTAVSPDDYASVTDLDVVFVPGDTEETVEVQVVADDLNEADETFTATVSDIVNAGAADVDAVATIVNDDPVTATVSIGDATEDEGDAGTTALLFEVTLSKASGQEIRVSYSSFDDTATTADGDYGAVSDSVSFAPGETAKQVTVDVNGDTKDEDDETFFVLLGSPRNVIIGDGTGQGTIVNDDDPPTVSIDDVSDLEGDAGTTSFDFAVSLSETSSRTITVDFAAADGTATTLGGDYVANGGTLTFEPGETSEPVSVLVNGDINVEANETFFVNLSGASNATFADSSGSGTIINDDFVQASLAINDVSMAEGDADTTTFTFTVTLSTPATQTVTVEYAAKDSTAVDSHDYVAASGEVTFPPGSTSQPVEVGVLGELLYEFDEILLVNLSNATNATIGDARGLGTVENDDDPASFVSIDDVSITEGTDTTTPMTFTVSLSELSGRPVSVDFASMDSTAMAPDDYESTAGQLTIPAGDAEGTITVNVVADGDEEMIEHLKMVLSNAIDAAGIADGLGVGTIVNDDGPVVVPDAAPLVHYFRGARPNPFNPITTVAYGLPAAGRVKLDIFDVSGRLVRTLVDEEQVPGHYRVLWNGRDGDGRRVASGVYYARLRAGGFDAGSKLTLLK